jgi:hypothetical protein
MVPVYTVVPHSSIDTAIIDGTVLAYSRLNSRGTSTQQVLYRGIEGMVHPDETLLGLVVEDREGVDVVRSLVADAVAKEAAAIQKSVELAASGFTVRSYGKVKKVEAVAGANPLKKRKANNHKGNNQHNTDRSAKKVKKTSAGEGGEDGGESLDFVC